jgi:hypothetical protein
MKLDHLTFGQLFKLALPETLMRATRAYHNVLRRQWKYDGFSVAAAEEHASPYFIDKWKRMLDFLRGPELKSALRKAAAAQAITPTPGAPFPFMTVNRFKFPDYRNRLAVSGLILMHCRHNGVPAKCRVTPDGDFEIRVETGPLGCALLCHKPGLKLSTIDKFCQDTGIHTWGPFPWVPLGTPRDARINPCVWPTNTPGVQEIAKELIQYVPTSH